MWLVLWEIWLSHDTKVLDCFPTVVLYSSAQAGHAWVALWHFQKFEGLGLFAELDKPQKVFLSYCNWQSLVHLFFVTDASSNLKAVYYQTNHWKHVSYCNCKWQTFVCTYFCVWCFQKLEDMMHQFRMWKYHVSDTGLVSTGFMDSHFCQYFKECVSLAEFDMHAFFHKVNINNTNASLCSQF